MYSARNRLWSLLLSFHGGVGMKYMFTLDTFYGGNDTTRKLVPPHNYVRNPVEFYGGQRHNTTKAINP